jgi:hypothetical protein
MQKSKWLSYALVPFPGESRWGSHAEVRGSREGLLAEWEKQKGHTTLLLLLLIKSSENKPPLRWPRCTSAPSMHLAEQNDQAVDGLSCHAVSTPFYPKAVAGNPPEGAPLRSVWFNGFVERIVLCPSCSWQGSTAKVGSIMGKWQLRWVKHLQGS